MRLQWDKVGERFYETGTSRGVLFPYSEDAYQKGVAWNGLTAVSESPSGAEPTALWADDTKYLNLYSTEEFGATVTAYTYPDEFAECDGSADLIPGVTIGQQSRKMFGLAYRTLIGNDTDGTDKGYKIHVIYGCKASPSEKSYATVNDSPEAIEFSWEISTTPVDVEGHKPTANLIFDSTKLSAAQMQIVEDTLYGTDVTEPRFPLPSEWITLLGEATADIVLNKSNVNVGVGETTTITATPSPKDSIVTWASADSDTATVVNGVVTGVASGTTTITASITVSGKTYSDSCAVTVTEAEG